MYTRADWLLYMVSGPIRDNRNGSTSPSEAVLETLAVRTDSDITELPSLYDVIDPEALDDLFADRENGTVAFDYCGHEVTISQSGEIIVEE